MCRVRCVLCCVAPLNLLWELTSFSDASCRVHHAAACRPVPAGPRMAHCACATCSPRLQSAAPTPADFEITDLPGLNDPINFQHYSGACVPRAALSSAPQDTLSSTRPMAATCSSGSPRCVAPWRPLPRSQDSYVPHRAPPLRTPPLSCG